MMQHFVGSLFALSLLCLTSSAQDVLYYKFDAGGGNKVINYATGTAKGPAEGTLMGTATAKQRWTTGKFQGGLMGASTTRQNYVSSGWDGAISGSFTVAWFMKLRGTQGTGLSYLYSSIGSFRCFTNGVAAKGLWVRAWGGVDIKLGTDVQALAAKGWTHVALVVDAKAKTATWYINGKGQKPIKIAATPNVNKGTSFRVGMHTGTTSTWQYDLDEFRFSKRAASSKEVFVWSLASRATDGPYGKGCGGTLTALFPGQVPGLGQAKYGMKAQFKSAGVAAVMLGASRHTLLGLKILPLDLGGIFPALKGCMLENSMDLVVGKLAGGGGSLSIPLPIPNDPGLSGATLYSQCLLLVNGKEKVTNGWAISIR